MKPFFVYMLRCSNGSYYVGSTDDLETRVNQHHHGTFDGHTAKLRPVRHVWSLEVPTRDEALTLELKVKRWSRAKKEALIAGDWDAVSRAARGRDKGRPATPVRPSTSAEVPVRPERSAAGAESRGRPGPTPGRPSTSAADGAAYARGERDQGEASGLPRPTHGRPSTPAANGAAYARGERSGVPPAGQESERDRTSESHPPEADLDA